MAPVPPSCWNAASASSGLWTTTCLGMLAPAAASGLARKGVSVTVYEAADTVGGGARSAALTLPGFVHDVCSAVYPMSVASPFFRELPLAEHGLTWIHPPAPFAHPLDGGTAA